MGRALRPGQIRQVLADGLLISKVMIVLHQAVEQRLFRGASKGLDVNRVERLQRHRQRGIVDQHGFRTGRSVRHCPRMWWRADDNSISPARSSISSSPRHTMSRRAPLACFHPQGFHNCRDNVPAHRQRWSSGGAEEDRPPFPGTRSFARGAPNLRFVFICSASAQSGARPPTSEPCIHPAEHLTLAFAALPCSSRHHVGPGARQRFDEFRGRRTPHSVARRRGSDDG